MRHSDRRAARGITMRLDAASSPTMARPARPLDDWLSGTQVAAVLAVTPSRVGQLRREHQLPATRTPLGYLYHRHDVTSYADRRHGRIMADAG